MERITGLAGPRYGIPVACLCLILQAVAATPALAGPPEEGKRVALIIGNAAYPIRPLKNAVNDARAMDKALQAAGFKTILIENASKDQMDDALGAFADMLGPDDVALFYYAGHAFQLENENFLVPVSFQSANGIAQTKNRCFSLVQLFEELNRARAKIKLIILDACRVNPIAETYSLAAGLAQPMNAGKETYIAFSTGPNQVAADNSEGGNSWFTEALSDAISQSGPSPDINDVLLHVRKRVQNDTEGRQTPWSQSSLTKHFYFRPPLTEDAENDPTLLEKWVADARQREQREDWPKAIELLNQVLRRKPGGVLEDEARSRLAYLTARQDAQARFEALDFSKAADLYGQAFRLDAFSVDAAFQAVDSYLLTENVPEAVRLLKAIRVRGTSDSAKRANTMLQELAAVSPEAGQELKAESPQPPAIDEVFSGAHFGVPDWDAGQRHLETSPVPLARWVNELEEAVPLPVAAPPAAPVTTAQAAAQAEPAGTTSTKITDQVFHLNVLSQAGSRELDYAAVTGKDSDTASIRKSQRSDSKAKSGDAIEFGFLQFEGRPADAVVMVDGKPVPQADQGKLQLPTGKYEIRAVLGDTLVHQQEVEIKPSSTTTVVLRR